LEWYNLPSDANYDAVLGLPDWPKFGLAITGIQRPYEEDLGDEEEDELRHYLDCGDHDEFKQEREVWLKETAHLWALNEKIPYGNHCTLEGALVDIDVGDARPIYVRQYKLPETQIEVLRQWRDELLNFKIIELADDGCQWNNPLNVQDKKDPTGRKGTEFRPCLDARELNKVLVNAMKGEIPYIEDMHEFANGNVVHTSWDAWKCYYQFKLSDRTKPLTAFTIDGVQYQFRFAPMGITPFSFLIQKVIQRGLKEHPSAKNYLDDILSSDKTIEEHKSNCTKLLEWCNKHNLRLRKSKCHFFQTRILSVGRIVSKDRIAIDPLHRETITNWPRPKTGSQVAALLGFAGFVRKHIPHFAQLTSPLEKLKGRQKSTIDHLWTATEEQAFNNLVSAMAGAVSLFQPNWKERFYLATDASKVGGGAMLYQKGTDEKRIKIIAFWSKSWNQSQAKYSAPQREFLAAKLAMEYFRTYLYGRIFTLVTDCRGIIFMLSKKDPSPMLQRYITAMRDYLFTLEHLPGIRNVIPDVLSRRFEGFTDKETGLNAITRSKAKRVRFADSPSLGIDNAMNHNDNGNYETDEIRKINTDNEYVVYNEKNENKKNNNENNENENIVNNEKNENNNNNNNNEYSDINETDCNHEILGDAQKTTDNQPLAGDRIELGIEMENPDDRLLNDGGTPEQRREIITLEHLTNHQGREATYKSLVDKGYHWKTMRSECGQIAKECLQCLRHNVEEHGFHPLTSIRTKLPMDHVAIDHYTMNIESNGFHAVLLIVDICTGFVFLRPVIDYTASEAMKACLDVFTLFGFPKAIQSDNGTAFIAELSKRFFDHVGVDKRTVTAYHPRANGAAEIRVKNAKHLTYKVLEGAITDWAFALPMINYWLNQRIQEKTGSTPFMYMFARRGNAFKDYRSETGALTMSEEELMKRYRAIKDIIFPGLAKRKNQKQDIIEERYNNKKRIVDTNYFPPGAMVMVEDPHRRNKHEPRYTGPYSVLRRTKGKSYVLLDHGKNELFPRDVAPSQMKLVSNTPIEDNEERFDIEAILNHRGRKGSYEYLVRWKGYGRESDSWEPAKQFDSPAMIEQYWKRRKGSGPKESDLRGHMNRRKTINQILYNGEF
jgi:hypothetical protein